MKIGKSTIELVQGDIADQVVDVLVNAANHRLAGGGGVDGAIHDAGGPAIMGETNRRYPDGCPTGSAVITGAGDLPAKHVVHAVGPVWQGGGRGEADLLASAYRRSLELVLDHDCTSVAIPALSAGAYGYPIESAAEVAISTVCEFLEACPTALSVRFVLWGNDVMTSFSRVLQRRA